MNSRPRHKRRFTFYTAKRIKVSSRTSKKRKADFEERAVKRLFKEDLSFRDPQLISIFGIEGQLKDYDTSQIETLSPCQTVVDVFQNLSDLKNQNFYDFENYVDGYEGSEVSMDYLSEESSEEDQTFSMQEALEDEVENSADPENLSCFDFDKFLGRWEACHLLKETDMTVVPLSLDIFENDATSNKRLEKLIKTTKIKLSKEDEMPSFQKIHFTLF